MAFIVPLSSSTLSGCTWSSITTVMVMLCEPPEHWSGTDTATRSSGVPQLDAECGGEAPGAFGVGLEAEDRRVGGEDERGVDGVDRPGPAEGGGHVVAVEEYLAEEDAHEPEQGEGQTGLEGDRVVAGPVDGGVEEALDTVEEEAGQLDGVFLGDIRDAALAKVLDRARFEAGGRARDPVGHVDEHRGSGDEVGGNLPQAPLAPVGEDAAVGRGGEEFGHPLRR